MFCAESTLLVCKNDSFPQPQIPIPDGKPVTAPVPKSQGTHYPSFSSEFIIRMHYETELLFVSFFCLFRLNLSAFAESVLFPQNGFLGHWFFWKNENKYWVIVYLLDSWYSTQNLLVNHLSCSNVEPWFLAQFNCYVNNFWLSEVGMSLFWQIDIIWVNCLWLCFGLSLVVP